MKKETKVCFNKDGMEFKVPNKDKYTVTYEGGGGPPMYEQFDTFDKALLEAKSVWGDCVVDIYSPNGERFGDESTNWNMPFKINLIRLRKNQLNPRQSYILDKFKKHPSLDGLLNGLKKVASSPDSILKTIERQLNDVNEANELFMSALYWGLFEIIEWRNGWMMAEDQYIEEALKYGKAKSL